MKLSVGLSSIIIALVASMTLSGCTVNAAGTRGGFMRNLSVGYRRHLEDGAKPEWPGTVTVPHGSLSLTSSTNDENESSVNGGGLHITGDGSLSDPEKTTTTTKTETRDGGRRVEDGLVGDILFGTGSSKQKDPPPPPPPTEDLSLNFGYEKDETNEKQSSPSGTRGGGRSMEDMHLDDIIFTTGLDTEKTSPSDGRDADDKSIPDPTRDVDTKDENQSSEGNILIISEDGGDRRARELEPNDVPVPILDDEVGSQNNHRQLDMEPMIGEIWFSEEDEVEGERTQTESSKKRDQTYSTYTFGGK